MTHVADMFPHRVAYLTTDAMPSSIANSVSGQQTNNALGMEGPAGCYRFFYRVTVGPLHMVQVFHGRTVGDIRKVRRK